MKSIPYHSGTVIRLPLIISIFLITLSQNERVSNQEIIFYIHYAA